MSASEIIIEQFNQLQAEEQVKVAKFITEKIRKDFVLSSRPDKVTVGNLESWLMQPDLEPNKEKIIKFIEHRLDNRYLVPLKKIDSDFKSGFLMMAIVCLLIETLQQFYTGDDETPRRKHEEAFKLFFVNENKYNLFSNCAAHSEIFYKKIRCGILHQAETKGGYRILQDGLLFDADRKTINATAFVDEIKKCLANYVGILRNSKNNDPLWMKAIKKLHHICNNCQAT